LHLLRKLPDPDICVPSTGNSVAIDPDWVKKSLSPWIFSATL
jgi:hypothetical protein